VIEASSDCRPEEQAELERARAHFAAQWQPAAMRLSDALEAARAALVEMKRIAWDAREAGARIDSRGRGHTFGLELPDARMVAVICGDGRNPTPLDYWRKGQQESGLLPIKGASR
jgi:hypothetical protein